MLHRLMADGIVIIHFLFIAFAVLGGLLALWRRWWLWLHLPALGWAALVVLFGWVCPLTPLEMYFREQGYGSGFIAHYIWPLIYPSDLTRAGQVVLGLLLLLFNCLVYAGIMARWRQQRRPRSEHEE